MNMKDDNQMTGNVDVSVTKTIRSRPITKREVYNGESNEEPTDYLGMAIRFIPGEVMAFYTAASAIIGQLKLNVSFWEWSVFALGLIGAPLWTWYTTRMPGKKAAGLQIVAATIGYLIWAFTLGGPFERLGWYEAPLGTLGLIGWSLFAPMFDIVPLQKVKKEEKPSTPVEGHMIGPNVATT